MKGIEMDLYTAEFRVKERDAERFREADRKRLAHSLRVERHDDKDTDQSRLHRLLSRPAPAI